LGKKVSQSVSEVAVVLSLQAFSVQGVVAVAVAVFQQSLVPLLPLNAEQAD
jgi:hypothetical protein